MLGDNKIKDRQSYKFCFCVGHQYILQAEFSGNYNKYLLLQSHTRSCLLNTFQYILVTFMEYGIYGIKSNALHGFQLKF